ncbi:MAG TPA: hypothetical protein VNA16_10070 [Abditibacteriaceae bacterium]|nr:hypothetical protein [Abditibacteriaceae bacterium]
MPGRLADRLSAARHSVFVGRASEQAFFHGALQEHVLTFSVLHVFGPGGVGKTTLLRELASACAATGVRSISLDARNIEPSPDAFLGALAASLELASPQSPFDFLSEQKGRCVLLIDTYELLAPLDNWLREQFLPQLPEDTLVVLAGRRPPAPGWQLDTGWHNLARVFALRNLDPTESRAYLANRNVPAGQHQAVLDFTHGHPLALSLVADLFAQRPDTRFLPGESPNMVKVLLEHLVSEVPTPAHREALEACALVRVTTESILRALLSEPDADRADAHELFEWLRSLSFIEAGAQGIFPHDLAREVLAADLRWRNPDVYADLHRRARSSYVARLHQATEQEQQRVLVDYFFLHRDNQVVRACLEWQENTTLTPDVARPEEMSLLVDMVAQHEGPESAHLAARWFTRQPQRVLAMRGADGEAAGFLMLLALHEANPEEIEDDPATRAAWNYLQGEAPLRPRESATFFRFWMARDSYQDVSAVQSLIFVNVVRHYLMTPGLAYTFFACAAPDFWAPVLTYADAARLPAVDFEVGGRSYGVYGHDWRVTPPLAWLALLAEREIAAVATAPAPPPVRLPLVVLSQPDFAATVQKALRHLAHPAALRDSPLLQSRLIEDRAGSHSTHAERVDALQTVLREACDALQTSPRQAKLYRALYHTYLHPAPTQEQAAELMDVPFSTFRRHLKSGVAQVVENLWHQEIGL